MQIGSGGPLSVAAQEIYVLRSLDNIFGVVIPMIKWQIPPTKTTRKNVLSIALLTPTVEHGIFGMNSTSCTNSFYSHQQYDYGTRQCGEQKTSEEFVWAEDNSLVDNNNWDYGYPVSG